MLRKVMFLLVLLALSISAVGAQDSISLIYLVDDSQNSQDMAQALADAYTALNPNVTIEIESRPGGTEGDNIVKTRLATGDMTDVFFYNSGSLLQALNPTQTLVDLSDQPFIANVQESFLPTVSQGEGIYGVPTGTAMGGGILYNKAVYEQLGLSVPTTWEEFAANNEAIKAAGIPPVLATFGDTWTSQLFVLGDYYNVEQAVPGFADMYTANQAKYATTPAAMAGFAYLQQGYESGWWQPDFATTRFEPGLALLASGEVAHYPMLTFALSTIAANFPDQINDIGFFAQPGASADANGATIWMPAGTYIPQTTTGAKLEAALDFLGFIASVEGVDAITAQVAPNGPYLIKGSSLPDTVLPAVQDLAAYIDSGNSYPALEFVSPIKGPNLEQICVAIATGQMSAEEGAANYDLDVERQAQQLGLPGW
ncbi:MAG: carbohydrate ABC transporter substrate-binding protein [Chloroflexi bacterium]|nr:carbohydrate ABC transporter substrate-binding protein [Chloroflexota bacterium]